MSTFALSKNIFLIGILALLNFCNSSNFLNERVNLSFSNQLLNSAFAVYEIDL